MELILSQLFIFILTALVYTALYHPKNLSGLESWFNASTALGMLVN